MSPIGSSPSLLGLIQLDMGDDYLLHVELLCLGVVLQVIKESQEILDGLLWPSSLGPLELGGLAGSSDASVEPHEGNALLVLQDLTEVLSDLIDGLSLHHLGCLVGVLEAAGNLRAGGLGVFLGLWLN